MTITETSLAAALSAIDRRADELVDFSRAVLEDAETGYREVRTAAKVEQWMRESGLEPRTGIAMTGVVGRLETGRPGPNIAVMGELDGLLVPGHPHAHPETGAAHACGHHAQLGNMLGVLAALTAPGAAESLAGSVTFMAVPAEEYIELEYRDGLRAEGKIEFFGGKQEFVRLGEFDDVDLAMMTHTTAEGEPGFMVTASTNGMIGKTAEFRGVAAHAGSSPHDGVNALNAAHIALGAIHANRETFKDSDFVRVHPIITHGGDVVNSVPARVNMEMYVRAASIDAMIDSAGKVDRALRAGAFAVGAQVEVRTTPGYMPSNFDPALTDIYRKHAEAVAGPEHVRSAGRRTGSTDAGDISLLLPTVHAWVDSASGKGHGDDYLVQDYDLAVVKAAKAMAATVIELLSDDAALARKVTKTFEPQLSRERYLSQLRELRSERVYTA